MAVSNQSTMDQPVQNVNEIGCCRIHRVLGAVVYEKADVSETERPAILRIAWGEADFFRTWRMLWP